MGNYSFSLNMFSNKNQDNNRSSFQSVLPKISNQNDANKKRKLSFQKTNKTAPSPPIGTNKLQDKVIDDKIKLVSTSLDSELNANFEQTESQLRRERMADCEFECSEITNYLYVGGYYVAGNRELLKEKGITYIINCSSAVVENHFIDEKSLKYLSFSLVDGRQDDISWFLCEVIKFITGARSVGGKVLIHCEKGISRSCSFAIAYYMWSTGYNWKTCFDYVKSKRKVCAPNTAFTCNLIELGDLLSKDNVSLGNLLFRCSYHLNHDPYTPCLKLCRNQETRKIIHPSLSILDTKGVYVLRIVVNQHIDNKSNQNNNNIKNYKNENEIIYIWCGKETTEITMNHALILSKYMYGIFTSTENMKVIKEGKETKDFLQDLNNNSYENSMKLNYDDYFDYPPSLEVILSSSSQMEADHTQQVVALRNNRPILQRRESSIKGFELFNEQPLSIESNIATAIVNIPIDNDNNQIINLEKEEQESITEPNTSRGNSIVSIAKASRVPSIRINSNGSSVLSNYDTHSLSLSRDNSTSSKIGEEVNSKNNQTLLINLSIPSTTIKDHNYVRRPSYTENLLIIENVSKSNNNLVLNPSDEKINIKTLPSYCESPIFEHLNSSSTTRSDILLSLESVIEKRNENYISPENSVNHSSTINNPFKKRFSKDKDMLQINNSSDNNNNNNNNNNMIELEQNNTLRKKSIDILDLSSSATSNVTPIESIVSATTEQTSAILTARPDSKNSSRPSSAVFASRNKVAPLNITNISNTDSNSSNPNTARSSYSNNTSRNRAATSETVNDTNSPRNIPSVGSKTTKTPGVLSTLLRIPSRTLSPVINSLPTTVVNNTSNNNINNLISNTNNNNSNIKNLNIPIIERTGTPVEKEKHPENISLSRAPTPIEDLTPVRIISGRVTPIIMIDNINTSDCNTLTPSDIIPTYYIRNSSSQYLAQNVLVKPLLYQAISCKQSRLSSNNSTLPANYEWQAMGVYDDEDLDDDSLFLLLCPSMEHFIWVGKYFSLINKSNYDNNDYENILTWVSSVNKGEVKFDDYIGNNLITNKNIYIIMSGTETDTFWQSFNEGY